MSESAQRMTTNLTDDVGHLDVNITRYLSDILPGIVVDFFKSDRSITLAFDPNLNMISDITDASNVNSLSIDFGSETIRGNLEVVADDNFGKNSYPLERCGFDPQEGFAWEGVVATGLIEDWLAEVTNRIIGAIASKIENRGIPITLSVPKVNKAPRVGLPCSFDEQRLQFSFNSKEGRVHVFLQLRIMKELGEVNYYNEENDYSPGEIIRF